MATEVEAAAPGAAQPDPLADADYQASLFQSTLQSAAQPRAAAQTASQPKHPGLQSGPQPTPASQAAAIYDQFQAGSSGNDYTNQDALREIRDKYDQAMKDGQKRGLKGADLKAFVVNQMTDVIQGQVACGILVSAHSYSKEPNAVLSKDLQQKLDAIGDGYKRATNGTMHVNSGYRTPAGQAAAMYDKFQAGASGKDYENQDALREIKHKYDQAMKDGEKRGLKGADLRTFVVSQMTDVIQGQVDHGMLISKHLTGDAADVRTNNLTQQQKNALEQAAKQAGGKTHPEGKPEHLHVEFPPQRVANK